MAYISRTRTPLPWQARTAPVVHGGPQGPLSQEALDRYRARGYLCCKSLFSQDEVQALLKESDAVAASLTKADERLIREPEGEELRSIFEVHKLSERFSALVRDPRLANRARQLLGGQVYIHQSRVNRKPGFAGQEFYWHSDFETWHVEDGMPEMRAVSAALSLTENYAVNGSLMVIPGSHKHFIPCLGEAPEEHYRTSLRRQEYGVPSYKDVSELVERCGGIDLITGPAGSVTFFECNLMHGSAANMTPYPRASVFLVYNAVENALVEPFSGGKARPEHIACRAPEPL